MQGRLCLFAGWLLGSGYASAGMLWKDVCTQADVSSLPFCERGLPHAARAVDYAGRLRDAEKPALVTNSAPGVARLSIPPYQWV